MQQGGLRRMLSPGAAQPFSTRLMNKEQQQQRSKNALNFS